MPSSSVRTFTEPDEYAATIRQGTYDLTITQPGQFAAKLARIDLHQLWMQRFTESLPRVGHVEGWGGRAILTFPTRPGKRMVRNGVELDCGTISWLPAGASYFHVLPAPGSYGSLSLPLETMTSLSEAMIGHTIQPPRRPNPITPLPDSMARLQRLHETAGNLAEEAPAVLAHPGAARGLEQALIAAMMDCLGGGREDEDKAAVRQHAAIMRRFHGVIEQHVDQPLYVPELCREIGTSERTLRFCCQEHLGMSPKHYLLLRRLHLVRRALRDSTPSGATVTEIATRYGFWQFGWLAIKYKALFGESPSATLARVPA